ncbi:two-component system activity regulator YycH [Exiguobacterium sp. s193]|uniref:YycH family regulatory protein n=1 Tax=Exiguobacterium sp. s193 TaxID=2751207 RepID=UPI001BE5C71A|nr:two-component system activity regulator YycH [Exiguobacterium sp. s193]
MMKQRLKTILLILLVSGSIFQTAMLWTYHPSSESIEQEQVSFNEIDASKTVESNQLVNPELVVYSNGQAAYQTQIIGRTMLNRIGASFDVGVLVLTDKASNIPTSKRSVEMIFPTPVSAAMLEELLGEKEIAMAEPIKRLYLLDYDGPILRLESATGRFKDFQLVGDDTVLKRLFAYNKKKPMTKVDLKGGDYTYVATAPPRLEEVFVYDEVGQDPKPLERIQNALFAENANVQQIKGRDGLDVLTDGVSVSTYDRDYNAYRFNTLSPNTQSAAVDYSTLVSYINIHGGWLDQVTQRSGFRYYFDQMSSEDEQQTALFRLYLNRYPVFGEVGPLLEQPEFDLATIKMTFEENQIRSISRSMLRANRKLLLRETTLPTIEQTVTELKQAEVMQDITGIRVGYKMTYKLTTSRYALFEPAWFVKQDGVWVTVDQATGKEG